jgi:putative sugar O-methyltransferase
MSNFLGWKVKESIATNYVRAINNILSSEENFKTFRRGNGGYTPILEHMKQNDGKVYADYIRTTYPHLLDKVEFFKENDLVGNPILFNYDGFGEINPTTLRYIKFLGDIEERFGDLNGYNLIELGGGYGGLIKVLNVLYEFKTIKMFDLPEPLKLQKKYLNQFDIDVETYTHEDEFYIDKKTLVISNYAWCECDKETRDIYMDKIISKCDLNFITTYGVPIEELTKLDGKQDVKKEVLNTCQIFTRDAR